MAKRLVPASRRPLAALALLGALCACATTSAGAARHGAARRLAHRRTDRRSATLATRRHRLLSATIGEALADGSEVSTGRGSRLIVDAPGRNISVGPNSRFVLPGSDGDDPLDQRADHCAIARDGGRAAARPHRVARSGAAGGGDRRARPPPHDRGLRQGRPGAGGVPMPAASDPDDRRPVGVPVRGRGAARGPVGTRRGVAAGRAGHRSAIQPKSAPAEMPTTSAPARSPTAGPDALPPSDMAAAPLADRAVQGAPTMLHQAAPEARPDVSADG